MGPQIGYTCGAVALPQGVEDGTGSGISFVDWENMVLEAYAQEHLGHGPFQNHQDVSPLSTWVSPVMKGAPTRSFTPLHPHPR